MLDNHEVVEFDPTTNATTPDKCNNKLKLDPFFAGFDKHKMVLFNGLVNLEKDDLYLNRNDGIPPVISKPAAGIL
ncbi:MAG: hypothetical protein WBH20_09365 [Oceanisphaera sp.]|uniref:hypothetical protein n=1 Tax=Oceanisphaera sp. TaxID=1929979 RepID=UPI003C7849DC